MTESRRSLGGFRLSYLVINLVKVCIIGKVVMDSQCSDDNLTCSPDYHRLGQ